MLCHDEGGVRELTEDDRFFHFFVTNERQPDEKKKSDPDDPDRILYA